MKSAARSALVLGACLVLIGQARSQSSVPVWTNFFNGSASNTDEAFALALDKSGNVFVTGASADTNGYFHSATVAYANSGGPLWTNQYFSPTNGTASGLAIVVNSQSNIFVTGFEDDTNGQNFVTLAYSADGTSLWTNHYATQASLNTGTPYAIAADGNGNVFVTGYSTPSTGHPDYATIGYSGAGVPLWTNRYNGPADQDNYAHAIAVDQSGNVFVTGFSRNINGGFDFATIAYSNSGVPLWTNRYDQNLTGDDEASAIAVDSNGNVFVTGKSTGPSGNSDFATVAYTGAGAPLWTNRYSSQFFGNNAATALTVDNSGNVYVTGDAVGAGGLDDYLTIAYSGAGIPLWTNRYDGGSFDDASAIGVDTNGNVFVTGTSWSDANDRDIVTISYSNQGAPLGTNRFNGPGAGIGFNDDYGQALAMDSQGNAFVTGYTTVVSSNSTVGSTDFVTLKYSSIMQQQPPPPPQPVPLRFQLIPGNVVLSWTNSAFSLQASPSLLGTFTNVPGATTPYTNSTFSSPRQFFRLIAH
jgi:hypothetical protein